VRGWRTAIRIAHREARRAKGRAALVIAMIAVPVAALAFGAVVQDTFSLKPDEKADRLMGSGSALVMWPYGGPTVQDATQLVYFPAGGPVAETNPQRTAPTTERVLAELPAGSRAITEQRVSLGVHTVGGTASLGARLLDYADPLARGLYRTASGHPPATADEIALTPAASHRTGAGIGGTVRLADGSRTFRVTGILEQPDDLRAEVLFLRPDALPASMRTPDPGNTRWLVATPHGLTWSQVKQLNTRGIVAFSRYVFNHRPPASEQYREFAQNDGIPASVVLIIVLVAGLAMLEVVLLAGPAFAVSARRRRRDLALVAAAGGTPAHLRRIVLADGVVLGTAAALTGVVLGILVAAGVRPVLEDHLAHSRSGAFRVYPLALAVLAGLAVLTGLLAAVVPAWIAARQDVVAALSGRRGITRSRRRWVVVGGLVIAAGAGTAAWGALRSQAAIILTGLAGLELGLVLCTPAIVGLVARAGRWLPLAPRIALRDTARNRTAAAPAIAAVMAAVIGSIAIGVIVSASSERDRLDYRSSGRPGDLAIYNGGRSGRDLGNGLPADTLATVRAIMPVVNTADVNMATCPDRECAVAVRIPPDRTCPYTRAVLRREPTPAEQRAARHDRRCDNVGRSGSYFGGGMRGPRGETIVIEPDAIGTVLNIPAADVDTAAAALRAGKVVVDDARYLENGAVTLDYFVIGPQRLTAPTGTVTAPGFVLPHPPPVPIAVMSPATARSLGLGATWWATLFTTSRMPTRAEQDRLQAAVGDRFYVQVEERPEPNRTVLVVLIIIAGVITLGAAAIATGLAAADGRADLATLAAVGASPRVRRALSLSQSGVIAGLGSLIGTVAGLGASVAVLAALNQGYAQIWPAPTPYPLSVPWLNVGTALVVVPLVAMLGAGLLTRSRLPIERRL
jgi:putative ABC transport system permease protein